MRRRRRQGREGRGRGRARLRHAVRRLDGILRLRRIVSRLLTTVRVRSDASASDRGVLSEGDDDCSRGRRLRRVVRLRLLMLRRIGSVALVWWVPRRRRVTLEWTRGWLGRVGRVRALPVLLLLLLLCRWIALLLLASPLRRPGVCRRQGAAVRDRGRRLALRGVVRRRLLRHGRRTVMVMRVRRRGLWRGLDLICEVTRQSARVVEGRGGGGVPRRKGRGRERRTRSVGWVRHVCRITHRRRGGNVRRLDEVTVACREERERRRPTLLLLLLTSRPPTPHRSSNTFFFSRFLFRHVRASRPFLPLPLACSTPPSALAQVRHPRPLAQRH